jgi:hypothetical protein
MQTLSYPLEGERQGKIPAAETVSVRKTDNGRGRKLCLWLIEAVASQSAAGMLCGITGAAKRCQAAQFSSCSAGSISLTAQEDIIVADEDGVCGKRGAGEDEVDVG